MDNTLRDTTVVVVGLGYIGLPTAAILAQAGFDVTGVDISERHVSAVNRGELPFIEEGLGAVVSEVVAQGRLRARADMTHADVYILAVPTPFQGECHEADLSYIDAAARNIAPQLRGEELIILESTSPPGTTAYLAEVILHERPDLCLDGADGRPLVHFAHCPERVLPGRIMEEMVSNARIVGGLTPQAAERAKEVYASFCEGEILLTDAVTAELAKLVENSFRDVNIAFANELSLICGTLGIDVWELISLANRHPRVNILNPGPGVGGHCIAVDPWFIVSALPEQARLIRTAREVNDAKPHHVVTEILSHVSDTQAPVVAALGLAFKANIDDLRESPAVQIVERLCEELPEGAKILAVEPHITELPSRLSRYSNIELVDAATAIKHADVVALLVDHTAFTGLATEIPHETPVVDTRGIFAR